MSPPHPRLCPFLVDRSADQPPQNGLAQSAVLRGEPPRAARSSLAVLCPSSQWRSEATAFYLTSSSELPALWWPELPSAQLRLGPRSAAPQNHCLLRRLLSSFPPVPHVTTPYAVLPSVHLVTGPVRPTMWPLEQFHHLKFIDPLYAVRCPRCGRQSQPGRATRPPLPS